MKVGEELEKIGLVLDDIFGLMRDMAARECGDEEDREV